VPASALSIPDVFSGIGDANLSEGWYIACETAVLRGLVRSSGCWQFGNSGNIARKKRSVAVFSETGEVKRLGQ
jgi:hypothetical protein